MPGVNAGTNRGTQYLILAAVNIEQTGLLLNCFSSNKGSTVANGQNKLGIP